VKLNQQKWRHNMPRLETVETTTAADIGAQLGALKADVAALTVTLGQFAKAQKNNLTNTASNGIHALRDGAVDQVDAARRMGEKSYANAENMVRNHPAGSIAVAAGVGFLVGMVATRR
jgi:ElaB/YqjD/DUF883 family membrane-anchored ribosome-binding protein